MNAPVQTPSAAANAIAVPPMPVKWTDLISDENSSGKISAKTPGRKGLFEFRSGRRKWQALTFIELAIDFQQGGTLFSR